MNYSLATARALRAIALSFFTLALWGKPEVPALPEPTPFEMWEPVSVFQQEVELDGQVIVNRLQPDFAFIAQVDKDLTFARIVASWIDGELYNQIPSRRISQGAQRNLYKAIADNRCVYADLSTLPRSAWKLDLQLRGIKVFVLCRLSEPPGGGAIALAWKEDPDFPPAVLINIVNSSARDLKQWFGQNATLDSFSQRP